MIHNHEINVINELNKFIFNFRAGPQHQITQKGQDYTDSGDEIKGSHKEIEESYDETYVNQENDDESSSSSDYESLYSESIPDLNLSTNSFTVKQDVENQTSTPTKSRRRSGQQSSTPRQSRSRVCKKLRQNACSGSLNTNNLALTT